MCLVVHSPFLDNYTLRVCPSVKFSVTSYYIISRHFKSEIPHREGETQGSGLRLSCPCPTHPEFCGDSLQMCLWGRQEGSMDFGVNAVLGGTMEKLPETVIKKTPKQLLCSYCAHAGKGLFISTLRSGRNLFQLAQFHCKLKKNRLDAYKTLSYIPFVRFLIQHMIFMLMISYDRLIVHLDILTFAFTLVSFLLQTIPIKLHHQFQQVTEFISS